MWTTNVNIINNAKWVYGVIKNVMPRVDLFINQDIEMTASGELSDLILPANSWAEFQQPEITASCSNPFLQVWGGEGDNLQPLYDTRDDIRIQAEMSNAMADVTVDERFRDYYKFSSEGRTDIYLQRLIDASGPTRGYSYDDIMAGKFGEAGAALMQFRTYPRIPSGEQVNDNEPFFTESGRMDAYCDIPEAIEFGENFVVHREGPEATPYLPNVIVSSNPMIRPNDFGHRARRHRCRSAHHPEHPAALERGQRHHQPALGRRLPLLLPHAQVTPHRALLLGRHGLERALGQQRRRPLSQRSAITQRRGTKWSISTLKTPANSASPTATSF